MNRDAYLQGYLSKTAVYITPSVALGIEKEVAPVLKKGFSKFFDPNASTLKSLFMGDGKNLPTGIEANVFRFGAPAAGAAAGGYEGYSLDPSMTSAGVGALAGAGLTMPSVSRRLMALPMEKRIGALGALLAIKAGTVVAPAAAKHGLNMMEQGDSAVANANTMLGSAAKYSDKAMKDVAETATMTKGTVANLYDAAKATPDVVKQIGKGAKGLEDVGTGLKNMSETATTISNATKNAGAAANEFSNDLAAKWKEAKPWLVGGVATLGVAGGTYALFRYLQEQRRIKAEEERLKLERARQSYYR